MSNLPKDLASLYLLAEELRVGSVGETLFLGVGVLGEWWVFAVSIVGVAAV